MQLDSALGGEHAGASLRRFEDDGLLRGEGRYTTDVQLPGQLHAVFVRSPHALAEILSIDTEATRDMPGVVAVWTGADLVADGIGPLPFNVLPVSGGAVQPTVSPPRFPLAVGVARHIGDPVAIVVADTRAAAQDAAEALYPEYVIRDALLDPREAAAAKAPQLSAEVPGNVAAHFQRGDHAAVERAFAAARHVVTLDLTHHRVAATSLEPRAVVCDCDPSSGRTTIYVGCQVPLLLRAHLAEHVLKVAPERLRIIVGHIGGGFGMKAFIYPEYAAVAYAAGKLRRPIGWRADRSESFISDAQARDHVTRASLALDDQGTFLALRVETLANAGGYLSFLGAFIPTDSYHRVITGVYRTPHAFLDVRVMLTTTLPVDAYRGAGRPEAIYVMERLVDAAAATTGIDRVSLRRRNMITPGELPFRNPMGFTYDSGAFANTMDLALARSDWAGFSTRAQASRDRGKLRGIGLSTYIKSAGKPGALAEQVDCSIESDGSVIVVSGTQEMGQGLPTAYAQLVAAVLQIPAGRVRVVQGDTDVVTRGGGSAASRSLFIGGSAVHTATVAVLQRAKALAADALEVAEADLTYASERFSVTGTDLGIALGQLASRQIGARIQVATEHTVNALTWPCGCHVCEVEIDRATGVINVVSYCVVADVGRVINPLLVEGQIQGGVAQGLGQALSERCVYDPDSGQLLTGSLMDYAVPRADTMPPIRVILDESTPSPGNVLGAKGAGESGTVGALPAIVGAVIDALSPYGITHLDMPILPETVLAILCEKTGRMPANT